MSSTQYPTRKRFFQEGLPGSRILSEGPGTLRSSVVVLIPSLTSSGSLRPGLLFGIDACKDDRKKSHNYHNCIARCLFPQVFDMNTPLWLHTLPLLNGRNLV